MAKITVLEEDTTTNDFVGDISKPIEYLLQNDKTDIQFNNGRAGIVYFKAKLDNGEKAMTPSTPLAKNDIIAQ